MGNFLNIFTAVRNHLGLFLKLGIFAFLGLISLLSGQMSAQTPTPTPMPPALNCTPGATITEGDLLPGGTASFYVTSGPGLVVIDHVNYGTGLQSLTLVDTPTNAVVDIPEFVIGTTEPIAVVFRSPNPGYAVNFTLRAASALYAVNIRVRCAEICTPAAAAAQEDAFSSDIEFFKLDSRPGMVTIDHPNDGIGIKSLTIVGAAVNARVIIPEITSDTSNNINVNFRPINPNQELKFTLRAENSHQSALIYVRCRAPLLAKSEDDLK